MRKHVLLFFLLFLVADLFSQPAFERPKIGLVLGGGGAKGFAHIGTLQLIDSLNIPVDYIVGTSIGGIVGGLYAMGYDGKELERLAFRTDWEEIFSDTPERQRLPYLIRKETGRYQLTFGLKGYKPMPPRGLINGQKISLLLSSFIFPYQNTDDFDRLPIPFRCVAVDLVSGREVVLKSGSLAKALRATMAIPTVFSPVDWGDSLLVDGGLLNNLPVDVVKEMGADIVIAIDLASPLKSRQELDSAIEILEQTITIYDREKWTRNVRQTDIYINPNLRDFTAADFGADKIVAILESGVRAARAQIPRFVELIKAFNLKKIKPDSVIQQYNAYGIQNIHISGSRSMTDTEIKQRLEIRRGEAFKPVQFLNQVNRLQETLYFKQIDYEIIAEKEDSLSVYLELEEQQKPIIKSIYVRDQKSLPFSFIYHLLGIQPGDSLDTEVLNRRIMDAYALGYFENITYTIDFLDERYVDLTIHVREAPHKRLRLGLRYDDRHKLVAAASLLANNLLIPGLRWNYELQFAGLYKTDFTISYPSRTLNTPIYPFLAGRTKNIPTHIYDVRGNRITTYDDKSNEFAVGVGFLFAKYANLEIEFASESMEIEPSIVPPVEMLEFPVWEDDLQKIGIRLHIDRIDDVLLPRRGSHFWVCYETSLKLLGSDVSYDQLRASLDLYRTFAKKHTWRLHGFFGKGFRNVPPYKDIRASRPHNLIGLGYDQMLVRDVGIARLDYRYQYKKDIYVTLIANAAFDIRIEQSLYPYEEYYMAIAAGVKFLSPIGPLDLIYSVGKSDLSQTPDLHRKIYFTMGYRF